MIKYESNSPKPSIKPRQYSVRLLIRVTITSYLNKLHEYEIPLKLLNCYH